jgi:hypothetical protein
MNGERIVSSVLSATDTACQDVSLRQVIASIKTSGTIRTKIESIRVTFKSELFKHGDYNLAKRAIDDLKKQLPGITFSGTFTKRAAGSIKAHSGLLCADLDKLGDRLLDVREQLKQSPFLYLLFGSPSGDGLKAVFRVPPDASRHLASYRAVEKHVKELTGVQIDEACKDVARLCFLSYDVEISENDNAQELEPLLETEKPAASSASVNLSERQRIAEDIFKTIDWKSETKGYTLCPGNDRHTTGNGARDCEINLDSAPNAHCFHGSCKAILNGVNHELQSRIGKSESKPAVSSNGNGNAWPGLVSAKSIIEHEDTTQYLWAGALPVGGVGMLAGQPRAGKSTLALNLALAISRGEEFLGRATERNRTAYVSIDNSVPEIKNIAAGLGLRDTDDLLFHVGAVPDRAADWLFHIIQEVAPKLVVIDTFQRFLGIKEINDSAECTRMMDPINLEIAKLGCAILWVHHSGKSPLGNATGALGSIAIKGLSPYYFELTREEGARIFTSDLRGGKNFENVYLKLDRVSGWNTAGGNRLDAMRERAGHRIVELLQSQPGLTEREILESIEGCRSQALKQALRELVKTGRTRRTGNGGRSDPFHYYAIGTGSESAINLKNGVSDSYISYTANGPRTPQPSNGENPVNNQPFILGPIGGTKNPEKNQGVNLGPGAAGPNTDQKRGPSGPKLGPGWSKAGSRPALCRQCCTLMIEVEPGLNRCPKCGFENKWTTTTVQ